MGVPLIQEIFYWVINMSISFSVVGIIVFFLRKLPGIPRRASVFFWLIPFFRMTVPAALSGSYNLMSLLTKLGTKTVVVFTAENVIWVPYKFPTATATNYIGFAHDYFPIKYFECDYLEVNTLNKVFEIASAVWITVFLVIMLALSVIYFKTLKEIKFAEHIRDNIYKSERVISPAVYGIVRPKIVLPENCSEEALEYVLMHERMHIRFFDNLWRMVGFAAAAIHWFNPLSWIFLKSFLSDIELSCDERVIKKLDRDGAKAYAMALLNFNESKNAFASAFGGAKIKTRIENILEFKRLTVISALGLAVFIAAVAYILLTNAG